MTPSAVSQRLKLLEQQLGRRLLVRAKPVRLEAQGEQPRIGIAMNSDSLATWFVPATAAFAREHDAQLELQREDQYETACLLTTGATLAGVTSTPSAPPGCRPLPLGGLVYVAVAASAWRERWAGSSPGPVRPEVRARALRIDYDLRDHLQVEPLLARGELLALGGEPVTSTLLGQVAKTPSALFDALTDAVLETARRELDHALRDLAQPTISRAGSRSTCTATQ